MLRECDLRERLFDHPCQFFKYGRIEKELVLPARVRPLTVVLQLALCGSVVLDAARSSREFLTTKKGYRRLASPRVGKSLTLERIEAT